jgi:hypothetical protein
MHHDYESYYKTHLEGSENHKQAVKLLDEVKEFRRISTMVGLQVRAGEQPTIVEGNQPPIENIPTRNPEREDLLDFNVFDPLPSDEQFSHHKYARNYADNMKMLKQRLEVEKRKLLQEGRSVSVTRGFEASKRE